MNRVVAAVALGASVMLPAGASAQGIEITPLLDARLRHEHVDQDSAPQAADAVTVRLRAGAQAKAGAFILLAEGEGTLALVDDYNDTLPGNGVEPFPLVSDPENFELNRLQVSYRQDGTGATLGRQRIILDNARFVGNVGWRQNEQTFDAIRGQASLGPVALDATYSISQRTIFGKESPNEEFKGDFVFLNGGLDLPVADVKTFAYLIDYDTRQAFSSQTFGVLAKGEFTLPGAVKVTAEASYARQGNYGGNPVRYTADYYSAKLGATIFGFGVAAGYEELGSDGGMAAFQTPMATLHAFQGWADVFLVTPNAGVRDHYLALGRKIDGVKLLPGLNAEITYHEFDSDFGGIDYGTEWDAVLGFKLGRVGILAKYANYDADGFAADTEKLWLQADFTL